LWAKDGLKEGRDVLAFSNIEHNNAACFIEMWRCDPINSRGPNLLRPYGVYLTVLDGVGVPFMTLLGKGIRTREAQLWARNYEWLPYCVACFVPSAHLMGTEL
jgi:hypothetical protein